MRPNSQIPAHLKTGRWQHPSVLALLEKCGAGLCPRQIIRKRANELINYARRLGWSGPPYEPRILASILDIRVKEKNLSPGTDGVLRTNGKDQLEILVNQGVPKTRQNFTICHEIAHTVFPDCFELVRMRKQTGKVENHHLELELLCNLAASEMLMPMEKFALDVVYHGYSLKSVYPLAERYEASPEAVVRRMIATELEISCAVFCRMMNKPSEEKSQTGDTFSAPKRMRVEYTVPSSDFTCFIPKYKSVPDHSSVNQAALSQGVVSAIEKWGLRSAPSFRVEAQANPSENGSNSEDHRVTALIFPSYF
ncbi:MAG: ImmA/IrrE family metallo-endopeptidase [Deltaproteobacteria bacterium]|jgi:Zn-dependent peptidase ImmA (M78 family)